MKKINKKMFGFTLVEMLVVISIIAILSAVLAGGYINSQKNARDASRKLSLKSMSDALNAYYADYGVFPDQNTILNLINSQGEFSQNGIIYMKKMPKETGNTRPILYQVSPTGKSFKLFANLENVEDGSCLNKVDCQSLGYSISNECCYVITSSNIGISGPML